MSDSNLLDDNDITIEQNDELDEPMLSQIDARILGSLMEKQLTTPDAYPLTLNSLVLACNQKSSREPVTSLEEGDVQHCLYQLQDRKLVQFDYGSRANKFDQRLCRTLHYNEAEHAIFCIMLLRGPQTINELLSRSKRLYEFSGPQEVETLIEKLITKLSPQIMKMPQQSGQRECRYMHLLCGEPDVSNYAISKTPSVNPVINNELIDRVDALEKQVDLLQEQIKDFMS